MEKPRQAGKGPATGGDGLTEPWKSQSTMTWHIEGHAAAIMRQQKIKDAVLYINAQPCGKSGGCAETLSDVLPLGYTLTVFVIDSKTIARVRFPGNGRGLKDTA